MEISSTILSDLRINLFLKTLQDLWIPGMISIIIPYIASKLTSKKSPSIREHRYLLFMASIYGLLFGTIIGATQSSLSKDLFAFFSTIIITGLSYFLTKNQDTSNDRLVAVSYMAICCIITLLLSMTFIAKLNHAYSHQKSKSSILSNGEVRQKDPVTR